MFTYSFYKQYVLNTLPFSETFWYLGVIQTKRYRTTSNFIPGILAAFNETFSYQDFMKPSRFAKLKFNPLEEKQLSKSTVVLRLNDNNTLIRFCDVVKIS